jgi:hypothetical protein
MSAAAPALLVRLWPLAAAVRWLGGFIGFGTEMTSGT